MDNKTDHNWDLLARRDLANFINIRTAHPGDDPNLGDLLVQSFRETYARKLPELVTPAERELELRNVHARRSQGVVRLLELGFEIIGTYSLISPGQPQDESWVENAATLRCLAMSPKFHSLQLSQRLLTDAVAIGRNWLVDHICLHVQAGADGVARLYQKFGFRRAPEGDRLHLGSTIEGYVLSIPRGGGGLA